MDKIIIFHKNKNIKENEQKKPNKIYIPDSPSKKYRDFQNILNPSKNNNQKKVSTERQQMNVNNKKEKIDSNVRNEKELDQNYKTKKHHKNKRKNNASSDYSSQTYTNREANRFSGKSNKEKYFNRYIPLSINTTDTINSGNISVFNNNNNETEQGFIHKKSKKKKIEENCFVTRNKLIKNPNIDNNINIINEGNTKYSILNTSNNKKAIDLDLPNRNNIYLITKNNNNNSPRKKRSASVDNSNDPYSNLVNDIKEQILIEDNKNKENGKKKQKKYIFQNFLGQFINKNENEEIRGNNTTKHETKRIKSNNTQNTNTTHIFTKVHKKRIINFIIPGNNNKDNEIRRKNNEILTIKKELDNKDKKIRELLNIIEKQKNDYNIILIENTKLKEENNNLKNEKNNNNINNLNKNNINENSDFEYSDNEKNDSKNKEKPKYNNLITYNINKNNNYNIISNEINNFNNFIQNNNNYNNVCNEQILEQNENITEKERDNQEENDIIEEKQLKRQKKASIALERVRKINSKNKGGEKVKVSKRISSIAQKLEDHMNESPDKCQKRREKSVDCCNNNDYNYYNNNIIAIFDNQPVINKKKKKIRSFSFDG